MARIRSVHPGLFTDEQFVSCSSLARLLLIGLWTEADDQGVFEWKPITIKMRLFPADNIDITPLLEELAAAHWIKQFSDGDKNYGALRNFRRFQKPKSPNAVHPLPPDFRKYVGLDEVASETKEAEGDTFPQNGEIAPQMEGGGCKEDPPTPRRGANGHARVSKQEVDAAFDRFWAAYPRHETKAKAREKLELILKRREATADQLASAAASYARRMAAEGRPRDKIAHPTTWLNQKRWEDEAEFSAHEGPPEGMSQERWAELREQARQRQKEWEH